MLFYSSLSWFIKAGRQDSFLELTNKTERQRGFRRFSTAMSLVAEGAGEAMIEHGRPCVGHCPLSNRLWKRPAVGSPLGKTVRTSRRPDVIASNGKLHDEILGILAEK